MSLPSSTLLLFTTVSLLSLLLLSSLYLLARLDTLQTRMDSDLAREAAGSTSPLEQLAQWQQQVRDSYFMIINEQIQARKKFKQISSEILH